MKFSANSQKNSNHWGAVRRSLSWLLLVAFTNVKCLKAPDFPIEPEITFISISKTEFFQQTIQPDSFLLIFAFTDGDGDLGDDSTLNLTFTDSRLPNNPQFFRLPFIPLEGAGNGISGEVYMKLASTCCIYPDLTPPCRINPNFPSNTLYYTIQIEDRAGNKSNIIRTPDLTLKCVP